MNASFSKEIIAQNIIHQGQAAPRLPVIIGQYHVGTINNADGIVRTDRTLQPLVLLRQDIIPGYGRYPLVQEEHAEVILPFHIIIAD